MVLPMPDKATQQRILVVTPQNSMVSRTESREQGILEK
jgi:hypothetical protein